MEAAHRLSIAAQHRDRERGLPTHVFRLDVRAELDQEIEDVVALSIHREMERRLSVLEARHAAVEHSRVLLDQRLNQLEVSDGDRRKDVVTCAALDE